MDVDGVVVLKRGALDFRYGKVIGEAEGFFVALLMGLQ